MTALEVGVGARREVQLVEQVEDLPGAEGMHVQLEEETLHRQDVDLVLRVRQVLHRRRQPVIDQIGEYSPDFKDLILHVEIRTPEDIEREAGLSEGNIFHGELTMDQLLFNRPVPGYAQYRAPVPGLYMCASSTHPGGGVMAAPGANAAREILADLGRSNTVPPDDSDD